MSEEILVNVTPVETRVALVENGMLQEVYIERSHKRGLVGNIYNGRVVRVLPGMEAAFVDIGLERAAFIHVSDVAIDHEFDVDNGREADSTAASEKPPRYPEINALLREGQLLVVQVTKDPIGTKGARLTTQLSIPSRYLVLMPGQMHRGISQRIEDEGERERLKTILDECIQQAGLEPDRADAPLGFIIRTAADGVGAGELLADVRYLARLWDKLSEKILQSQHHGMLYQDLPLHVRTLRDLVRPETEKVRVDSRESFQAISEFAGQYVTELQEHIEYYPGERPIFDLYGVEDELQRALSRKVQLKSGGYLVIDQTEAMTTIDVNTGAFVGHRTLEETIFKTNLEATRALARQLRLRNLGGIIIIDFIDMTDPDHERQVLRMLEKMLERDHARTKITGVSELGLVEMTRKRTTESLGQMLCESCPDCEGRGTVKTAETVCYEIFREILRINHSYDGQSYRVLAGQEVVDLLLDQQAESVADLETFIGKQIRFQVEPHYNQEQFDVVIQ